MVCLKYCWVVIFGTISTLMSLNSTEEIVAEEIVAEEIPLPFHLMPLGSHLTPSTIDEVNSIDMVTPALFAKAYVLPRKPLVLRSAAKDWSAVTRWTDDYLRNTYGELEMKLDDVRSWEKDVTPPQGDVCLGRDTLAHFIDTYRQENTVKYIRSELPTPLYYYVNLPPPLACGDLSSSIVEVDVMMGSVPIESKLRKDTFDIMVCVINGTRSYKLIEGQHEGLVYPVLSADDDRSNHHYSMINPVRVDMKTFPNVSSIPHMYTTTLNTGDCLYIPAGTWHTSRSQGEKNAAVSFLFKHLDGQIQHGDCANENNIALPLKKVDPDWKYSGRGRMSMGNAAIDDYLNTMDSFFAKNGELKYNNVYDTLLGMASGVPFAEIHVDHRAKDLHEKLETLAGQEAFTLSMLGKVPRKKLRKLINNYVEPARLSNSYNHEYSIFPPEKVAELFKTISLTAGGLVQREAFIEAYTKMGGHVKIAKSVWKKYGGGEKEVEYKSYEDVIFEAVEKFTLYWPGEDYQSETLNSENSDEEEQEEDDDESEEGEEEGNDQDSIREKGTEGKDNGTEGKENENEEATYVTPANLPKEEL